MMRSLAVAVVFLIANVTAASAQTNTASAKQPPSCDHARFRPIVDVGHTLEEPGAISARGVPEYDFNLKLSLMIERGLRDAGFSRTRLLVTDGPALKSLVKRVAIANKEGGDIFLSIHHDSVPEKLIEKWTVNGNEMRYSDRFRGHSMFVSFDNPQVKASLQFGKLLGRELKDRGLTYTPHYTDRIMGNRMRELLDREAGVYRFDKLVVLRMTSMPALLLEAGSIIHRDEELVMATPERQEAIVSAVIAAMQAYCATRTPKAARTAGTRK